MATVYFDTYGVTDVIDSASYTSNENGAIMQDGMSQKSLYDLLYSFQTKFDAALAAMDADSGIGTETYATNALGGLASGYGIYPNGISQLGLVNFLSNVEAMFDAVVALLNADATLTDTNYASINIDTTKIKKLGISQGAIVDFLNTAVVAWNTLLVKLDADL